MEKKLTVTEAAKLLGVSKEAIYNRLRRGSLQSVVEEGVKYILLTKTSSKESLSSRKATENNAAESAYIELLKNQVEELKQKNEKLESDKERLVADKERLLIESKEKIEMIYKERDEQLKAILSLANRQIGVASEVTSPSSTTFQRASAEEGYVEEVDVTDEDDDESVQEEEELLESYSDWRDLRSYLKEKGFSKKEKQQINDVLTKKASQLNDVLDKNGKIFIKKGKKLKEILGE
ncbi:MAG: helix-turn-helix domain-containing protein [Sulfurospirillum cavolei]|nr:helix-turn-helix domain-containing protein [Sulfurospirillum cavolei]